MTLGLGTALLSKTGPIKTKTKNKMRQKIASRSIDHWLE
jgi:hypothetical protein